MRLYVERAARWLYLGELIYSAGVCFMQTHTHTHTCTRHRYIETQMPANTIIYSV